MRVISSQHHRDESRVAEKMDEIGSVVTLPVIRLDDEMAILVDGHHTHEAAIRSGVEIRFRELTSIQEDDRVGLDYDDLLDACWMDGDYYYLDTGNLVW